MGDFFDNALITINPQTVTTADDGSWKTAASGSFTVWGSFQPQTGTESLLYLRNTGKQSAYVYLPTLKSDGTALSVSLNDQLVIDGVTWRVAGPPLSTRAYGYIKVAAEAEV